MVQGLLLDLDAATLTVWVNAERKGVMVQPGMIGTSWVDSDSDSDDVHDGEPVGRLVGPLRWAVNLYTASVSIDGPLPPPA